jgi:hypothetical protein
MEHYPRIAHVEPLAEKRFLVTFGDGTAIRPPISIFPSPRHPLTASPHQSLCSPASIPNAGHPRPLVDSLTRCAIMPSLVLPASFCPVPNSARS